MNSEIGQSFPRDDIVKKGSAVWKIGKLGVQRDCRLVLRGYVAPFRLEVYPPPSSVSGAGKVFSLENVKQVKCCGSLDQNVSLRVEFNGSISLFFTFVSERETEEWMQGIQMRSIATKRQLTLTSLKSHVFLMPNSNCHLTGSFSLDLTHDAIRMSDARDATPRIVWPVHTIRFYGYRGKIFSVATTSCSETGEGVFHVDALGSKEAEFIYDCVAALVSRRLKVAAAAFWSVPPSSSSLPDSVSMPSISSSSSSSLLSNGSTVNGCSDGELVSASGFSSSSADINKTPSSLWNNCFYLKAMGMSLEQPTKSPKLYGLTQPKRELLEAFPLTLCPLDQLTCGVVLYGPSNCGKRLLVRMAAVHWSTTLLCIPARHLLRLEGEPECAGIEMLFDVAMAQAPCIILIRHLEDILPSSASLLSDSEVGCAARILQKVEDELRGKRMKGVGIVGTIGKLSEVTLPLPPFRWMDHKIYVSPPCLETRRQVFEKELQDLLRPSQVETEWETLLAQSTHGFDFVQLMDVCRDVRRIAAMDAMDEESRNDRCEMRIRDMRKVRELVEENATEGRRVYEETSLSSARYYAKSQQSQETALFVVKLMPNETLPGVSICFLRISDSSVDLLNLDPSQMIVCWPLTTIRKHTWTPLSLLLEIGRNSQTKAGEFHFETIAAKTISEFLKKTLHDKKIELDTTNL